MLKRTAALFCTFVVLLSFCAPTAPVSAARSAAVITVNSLLDPEPDGCDITECTLREAILESNASLAETTIVFSVSGTIILGSYLSVLGSHNVTITGPITLSGDYYSNIMAINVPGRTVTLRRLAFIDGFQDGNASGGGLFIFGGAVLIEDCTFSDNHTLNGSALAIYGGTAAIDRSAFTGNGSEATGSLGGAILNGGGNMQITNSTFQNNTAENGGAIANSSGFSMTIENSTIAGNHVSGEGNAAVTDTSGSIYLHNSIISGTTGAAGVKNCAGGIFLYNLGNNIDSGTSCGFSSDFGSMSSTDPRLGPLGYYGGPTQTMRLLHDSPAIDGVTNDPTNCPSNDQRLARRPLDGNGDGTARCDIGAYESGIPLYLPLVIK